MINPHWDQQGSRSDRPSDSESLVRRSSDTVMRLRAALKRRPDEACLLSDLGMALMAGGQEGWPEAEHCFRRLVKADPTDYRHHLHLGSVLARQNRWGEAGVCFQRALPLTDAPDQLEILHGNWGFVLECQGQAGDAEQQYRRALGLGRDPPRRAHWHRMLAQLLAGQAQRLVEFEYHCRESLRLHPHQPQLLGLMGAVMADHNRPAVALDCFKQELASAAASGAVTADMAIRHALLLPVITASTAETRMWRHRLESELDGLMVRGLSVKDPFAEMPYYTSLPAYQGVDDRPLREKMALMYLRTCPALGFVAPHCARPSALEKASAPLRLGIDGHRLTGDGLGRSYRRLIGALAAKGVQITLFEMGPPDDVLQEMESYVHKKVDLRGSFADVQRSIARECLDVMFYPAIADHFSYFLAFSRFAHAQCVGWGSITTTGIPNIDYHLTDGFMEKGWADTDYSENLIILDKIPAVFERPNLDKNENWRDFFDFSDDSHIYVCAQSIFKINPDFDQVLAEILRKDPKGLLVLVDRLHSRGYGASWLGRFKAVDPEAATRVVMLPGLPLAHYYGLLQCADVLLDTPLFSGGLTSLDALAFGLAPITMRGRYARSRQTAGLFERLGITETIAATDADYVTLAGRMVQNPAWRADLKRRIIARHDRLFDDYTVVEPLIAFFQAAVSAAKAGQRLGRWPAELASDRARHA